MSGCIFAKHSFGLDDCAGVPLVCGVGFDDNIYWIAAGILSLLSSSSWFILIILCCFLLLFSGSNNLTHD